MFELFCVLLCFLIYDILRVLISVIICVALIVGRDQHTSWDFQIDMIVISILAAVELYVYANL